MLGDTGYWILDLYQVSSIVFWFYPVSDCSCSFKNRPPFFFKGLFCLFMIIAGGGLYPQRTEGFNILGRRNGVFGNPAENIFGAAQREWSAFGYFIGHSIGVG